MRLLTTAIGVTALTLCLASSATADKVDDFKRAAASTGCNSIPYGGSRGSCKGFQSQVNQHCKRSGPRSCNSLKTKGLIELNRTRQRRLADLKRDRKKNASEIRKLEEQIRTTGKEINRRKAECRVRIARGKKCYQYRQRVMTVFANVKRQVGNERDKRLQSYKRTLISKYTSEERGHQIAIDEAKRAVQKCEDAKAGRL